jgi:hypothetical protein
MSLRREQPVADRICERLQYELHAAVDLDWMLVEVPLCQGTRPEAGRQDVKEVVDTGENL